MGSSWGCCCGPSPPSRQSSILDAQTSLEFPVVLSLSAGTYDVVPVGPADGGLFTAGSIWAGTNCTDPDGCIRTAPTGASGWLNWYDVASPALVSVSAGGVALSPVSAEPTSPPLEPFFLVSGTDRSYRGGGRAGCTRPRPTRSAVALSSQFTLSVDADVRFWFPDGPDVLFDNRGGMSLDVTPFVKTGTTTADVTEPASVLLLTTGLVALVGRRRRRI